MDDLPELFDKISFNGKPPRVRRSIQRSTKTQETKDLPKEKRNSNHKSSRQGRENERKSSETQHHFQMQNSSLYSENILKAELKSNSRPRRPKQNRLPINSRLLDSSLSLSSSISSINEWESDAASSCSSKSSYNSGTSFRNSMPSFPRDNKRTSSKDRRKFNTRSTSRRNSYSSEIKIDDLYRNLTDHSDSPDLLAPMKMTVDNNKSSEQKYRNHHPRSQKGFHHERFPESLSYPYIKSLCTKPNDLILISGLKNQTNELENFFRVSIKKEQMSAVLDFILRVCRIEYELSKQELLNIILRPLEIYESISSYVDSIIEYSRTVTDTEMNFKILVHFYKEITNYIPNSNMIHFKDLLFKTLHIMKKIDNLQISIVNEVNSCIESVIKKIELIDEKQITYKSLSVFPTKTDLNEEVALRPNIINGPYCDVDNYIDIQFKLLKEDFVSGLRNGLKTYFTQIKEKVRLRNQDIFIYNNVKYMGMCKDDNPNKNLMHSFELDKKPLKKVQWDSSKRLIHGSLVLFSKDNFETYFMGRLEDRIGFKTESKNWIIIVSFLKNVKISFDAQYVMVEARVFFEPFFHVLNKLKETHPSVFPLEKYIVHCDVTPKRPSYLAANANYVISDIEIPVNNLESWPKPEVLGLNHSQLVALQAAVTREFVVIQGPPGTGKTYLGKKIINILLDNKDQWGDGKSPIFIACYRNNAVDQMLESLALNGRRVVRLGGRSACEALKDCTLKNTIGHLRDPIMHLIMNELKCEISTLKTKINEVNKLKLFVQLKHGILNINVLSKIMNPNHFKYLSTTNSFENWLLPGNENTFNDEMHDYEDIFMNPLIQNLKNTTLDQGHPFVYISLHHIVKELNDLYLQLEELSSSYSAPNRETASPEEMQDFTDLISIYNDRNILLQRLLNGLHMKECLTPISKLIDSDLLTLSMCERWCLYEHWANQFVELCEENLDQLVENHNIKLLTFLNKKDVNDGENLRTARVDVIGATTTGAARLNKLISIAKPKIVIIEEAAEVLEAHAIGSLTEHCEHLILIGDHKQLRPSPASHVSCTKYRLDVSLFERMIMNNMECFTLTVQHRMRPEISSLVVPQIYPTLCNHPSVEDYPQLKGVKKNLFFVDHSVSEDVLEDNDSHQNKYEAYFILALADYLIKQGYEKRSITILTMYGAQLLFLKNNKKNYPNLEDVEIQVVDNYQGEENDVILMSLVRSNSSTIGFLSKENRVCVALSRARQGFILVGNMETLQVNSAVWKGIRKTLVDQASISEYLPLKCETHHRITKVKSSDDFKPLKLGGCTNNCGITIQCGHICNFLCHPIDLKHEGEFSCKAPCERKRSCGLHNCKAHCGDECPPCDVVIPTVLPCGHNGSKICAGENLPCKTICDKKLVCDHKCTLECHPETAPHGECHAVCNLVNKTCPFRHNCTKICGEECGECEVDSLVELKCGHLMKGICKEIQKKKCKVLVEKELNCGHKAQAPCHKEKIICKEPTIKVLDCSHAVNAPCHEDKKDIECKIEVEKILPCGHKEKTLCSIPVNEVKCNTIVSKLLQCGHIIEDVRCSTDPLLIKCRKVVNKKFIKCGHTSLVRCCLADSLTCPEPCEIVLNCGHKCTSKCGGKCSQCNVKIKFEDSCGHQNELPCYEIEARKSESFNDLGATNCEYVCNQLLECNHTCKGTCGECMQGRVHSLCNAICNKILLCGHRCEQNCFNDFHLCTRDCMNSCKHQKCKRKCGEMCTKCMEQCDWACNHYKCTRKCWEPCNRLPCEFPCQKTLKCGHPCCGYCGEPCPPVCFFCSDTKEDLDLLDRYILLEECDHVISAKYAIGLMKREGIILCPKCQTPIVRTKYFRNHSRAFFNTYSKLKTKAQSIDNNKGLIIKDFRQKFKLLNSRLKEHYEGCSSLNKLLKNFVLETVPIMTSRNFNVKMPKSRLKSLLFLCYYITEALKMTKISNMSKENSKKLLHRIDHFASYLLARSEKISLAQMLMFYKELTRLRFIIDFMQLEQDITGKADSSSNGAGIVECYKEAKTLAFGFQQFTNEDSRVLVKHLTRLKVLLLSNHILLCNKDEDFQEMNNFFVKYYPMNFHLENWESCDQKHLFYSFNNFKKGDCPVCSGKTNDTLFINKQN